MIIQLESGATENIDAARQSLEALARSWGHELTEAPTDTRRGDASAGHDEEGDRPAVTCRPGAVAPVGRARRRRPGRPHPQAAPVSVVT